MFAVTRTFSIAFLALAFFCTMQAANVIQYCQCQFIQGISDNTFMSTNAYCPQWIGRLDTANNRCASNNVNTGAAFNECFKYYKFGPKCWDA
ncbi:hypothetical protein K457DRAFT_20141 [Linnemannia elongata AG-77]|uniref:Secreted protein n=1 Tax=Linnemannia elongata AG-77 TaxID=1314771 RepID=A0A197JWD3_9FUNG|nr:hypothetical protein K457DRAFT_20141 [Linnemannia elongata AG-77]